MFSNIAIAHLLSDKLENMWSKGLTQFIVILLAARTGLSTLLPKYLDLPCEVSFTVDPTVSYQDWRQQYAKYLENESTVKEILNINFPSFQQALLALNSNIFDNGTNTTCVEILVSEGTYTITNEIIVKQNVRIVANESDKVFITFNISMPSNPGRVFNVITFRKADFVILMGIHFLNSSGIITIEHIDYVHVSNCHFK